MAQSVIGALRVNLGLDSAQFTDGLKKAEGSSNSFARAMKVGFAAAAAAATAALAAVAVGVRNTLNSADEMSKMAQKIGIPIEELSKLKYAADMSGVSLQGLQTGVSRLSRNMADAAKGTGAGAEAFKRLGINVKGADGSLKSSSAVMAEMADKFAQMPDGAQKTAIAMELMGRSGADMIPMLNGGSAALNELLMEAKELGLEISSRTGKAAEQFNDNISRMGYAISGLTLGITAALAPALVVVTDAMVQFTKWVLSAVDYLPVLAEYAAVAGGALALMFAPTILAAAQALTIAIGVGMVGAVRALTAAIAANPIGALAVAIVAAVTAAYHFRDEIQKAIGIDVVAIVKDAANLIINSFRAVFYDIELVVNSIPDVFIAAGEAAANGFLRAMNEMARTVIVTINTMISSIRGAMRGTMLEGFGNSIPMLENKVPLHKVDIGGAGARDRLSSGFGGRNKAIADIMASDPIGAMGRSFTASTPAVENFSNAIADANNQLDDMGGGGGKDGKAGGKSKLKAVKDGVKDAAKEMERFVDSVAGAMTNIFQGLIDGSKSVKETISDLLKQLSSMLMNEGFKALMGGMFGGGGGGGLFGGLFSGIGKLFGFARGGTILPGGAGGIDSQLVAFRKSPNERVDITKPGQSLSSGRQEVVVSGTFIDDNGVIKAQVTQMGAQAAQAGASIAVRQVNQGLPSMLAESQARKM